MVGLPWGNGIDVARSKERKRRNSGVASFFITVQGGVTPVLVITPVVFVS